jgi:hypothetical protein
LISVGGGFQEAVRRRGGVSAVRCLAARRYSEIAVSASVGTDSNPEKWRYALRLKQDMQRRPVISSERVFKDGRALIERPDKDDERDPERLSQTHLEQVNVKLGYFDLSRVTHHLGVVRMNF